MLYSVSKNGNALLAPKI